MWGVVHLYNEQRCDNLVAGPKLYPGTKMDWMHFGVRVAIKGDYIVAGAPSYDAPGLSNSGAWFSFKRVNGVWQTSITHISTEDESRTGSSVAIDGEAFYVGAGEWNSGSGRVGAYDSYGKYIYHPDPYKPASFGRAVSADNGYYVIGAPQGAGSVFFGMLE